VGGDVLLLGVAQAAGLRDLEAQLRAHYPRLVLRTILVDRAEPEDHHRQLVSNAMQGLGERPWKALMLLADVALDDILYLHSISAPAKDVGLPVVSCFGRPIFYGDPTNIAGLTYEGIFSRTSFIAKSLHATGDYLEFGVFDGRTMTLAWQTMKRLEGMRFFGFDSFRGIQGAMAAETSIFPDGSYYSNLETFEHNMKAAGVDAHRVRAVEGSFRDLFREPAALQATLGITRCLVAHIDCDVYEAAKASLNFLTGLVVQGSVLLFDEFHINGASNHLGERLALREWLAENSRISVEPWQDYASLARAFFVHVDD
jgi:hypothetical protein